MTDPDLPTPSTPNAPPADAPPLDPVVLADPGTTLTATGEEIVEQDIDDDAFEAALDETMKSMDVGQIVEGVVVKVDPDEVLLDIGWKSEGVIPSRELSIKVDIDPNEVVQVGDIVEALIMDREDELGRIVLSKKRAQYERAWGTIERIYNEDKTVQGSVIEVVKGGLILDIGLRGFLPASLVEMRRVRDLTPFVGQTLECKIIELDKNRNNVVLSRRKFLEETQSEFRTDFLQSLQKGEVRKGVVSSIVNFGAFVDLGGVDGLVHVSELSWHHIDHPSEVVEVGDEVEVEVLEVDLERERVSLSLKATQEDPWHVFAREAGVGAVAVGEVTKLVPFGAFVKVADGIEGLVHISELSDKHIEVPEAVVNVGDKVDVKVIDIDTVRRRISLSLKQALSGRDDGTDDDEEAPTAETAYSSADDGGEDNGTMAGALAAAGLVTEDEPVSEDAPTEQAAVEPDARAEPEAPAEPDARAEPDAPAEPDASAEPDAPAEEAPAEAVGTQDAPADQPPDEEPAAEEPAAEQDAPAEQPAAEEPDAEEAAPADDGAEAEGEATEA